MTADRKSGASNVTLTTLKRKSSGVMVAIQNGYRRSGNSWVRVYSAYVPITSVTISGSTNVFQPLNGSGSTTLTASSSGNGTKSYAWSKLSGFASVNLAYASGAVASVTDSTPNNTFTSHSAVFRCIASDGTSSAYKDVTVTFNGTA